MCFTTRNVSAELHKREECFREALGTDSLIFFTSPEKPLKFSFFSLKNLASELNDSTK